MATREQTYPADSHEPAITQALTRAYAINWEVVAYAVILVAAFITRFADLGARVMSHDESLHTYYSWRLYEFGEFNHTPLMHGPVLFHMTALSYFLFGDSDFTARIYPAVLGIGLVMFPLLLRRWLGRVGALLASIMLLISPMVMYYNRYIREDTPSVFYTVVMVYALLQYIDGERPRRPVWLWVMSGALLLTLASKEVAFIYVAIFGSFLVLYWLMRIVQDVGVQRRPRGAADWQPPRLQLAVGHVLLLAVVGVIVVTMGGFLRFLISPLLWTPSDLWFDVPLFVVLYVPLAVWGLIHSGDLRLTPGKQKREEVPVGLRRDGAASAMMQGLSNGKSALLMMAAGVILGAIVALLIVCVIDVIKPEQVWTQKVVMSQNDMTYGTNVSKEYAVATRFDSAMFVRLLTWIGLPVLGLIFVVFLAAVFKFPGHVPLPWREILIVLLIALVTTSAMMMLERRSHVKDTTKQPFAVDPNAVVQTQDEHYDNLPILVAWVIGSLAVIGVWATRLMTGWWDFLNRQPVFDVLIVIGTLVLPWLAAFPLYWAGYNLEDYNPNSVAGRDTLRAALPAVLPFVLTSISVGLAWNWKRWLPAAAVFLGLFAFFFTTVFSNQYGLVTGMIGSLGYWLEQQEVRRGSQPQYYYVLTQLPVYEFLPLIGAMLAGVTGLSRLWAWRRDRIAAAREAEYGEYGESGESGEYGEYGEHEADADTGESSAETVVSGLHETDPLQMDTDTALSIRRRTRTVPPRAPDEAPYSSASLPADGELETPDDAWERAGQVASRAMGPDLPHYFDLPEPLTRPYSPDEEHARRAADPEWVGAFPFLALVGYWAIMNIFALTIAGEKMPWLTIHLTVPLILATGWWLGEVVTGIRWDRLRDGGWLVLLVMLPLALMAAVQVVLGVWEGSPFRGRDVQNLAASGNWLAAILVLVGALYAVGHFGRRLGAAQLARMAVVSGAALLAILTARVAVLACFINYDYATEFLVYAHAGPAVKTVLHEVDRIATLTNEGSTMRIVFDDESSWPYTWYFRDYPNYGFLRGEAGSVDSATLDGARIVVVGSKKAGDVRRILGDRYYEFNFIRLWWPMQEYFNLNFNRVANIFGSDEYNVAARYYRRGLWDIWWARDYSTYAQAMCIESKQSRCEDETAWGNTPEEKESFRLSCQRAVVAECRNDDRFNVNKWPVSDRMYFFVDKEIAAKIWDAGIGSSTVNIRAPEYPEDKVFTPITAEAVLGAALGMRGPRGIAIDAEGLIYVADTDRNQIVVMNQAGEQVRTIGGTTPSGDLLLQPWGLDIGPDGLLYVADTWHHQVKVFTPQGDLLRAWGHEGVPPGDPSPDAMWGPRELKVGPDGNVYVADTGNKRIRVYTATGEYIRDIGSGGSRLGQLDEPVGLAFNPVSHHLYVAEAWNKRVQVFDPTGLALRTIEVNMWFRNRESFNRPYLAVSPDGTLIVVTDMDDNHRLVAYNLDGAPVYSFNQPDNLETGQLGVRSPAGLAFDSAGRLYVVDAEQARVFVFPPPEVQGDVAPAPAVEAAPPESSGEGETVPGAPESGVEVSPTAAEGAEVAPTGTGADVSPVEGGAADLSGVREYRGAPFVYVPEGCFAIGADDAKIAPRGPEVCLSGFWIGRTEVTHAQYAACVDAGACTPPQDRTYYGNPAYADAPVVLIDWEQAAQYAAWIGGTLPTEAQWEYAARGPAGVLYPWGDDAPPTCALANTEACGGLLPVGGTHRVAGASWIGALDMAGSAWEWTADWYADDAYAALEPGITDPTGPAEGSGRVVRGGAWNAPVMLARTAYREARDPIYRDGALGFRVVLPADAIEGESR